MPRELHGHQRTYFRYSLRALLIAVVPVCLLLGLWKTWNESRKARFVRVNTTAARTFDAKGQTCTDQTVKLRSSKPFTVDIEYSRKAGRWSQTKEQTTPVVRSVSSADSTAGGQRGVDLRIRYQGGTVEVFSNERASGSPLLRKHIISDAQALRSIGAIDRELPEDLPLGQTRHVLRVSAWYGSHTDEGSIVVDVISIRVHRR